MPEGEALFFLEMGVMIKKIREKASASGPRSNKHWVLGDRKNLLSPTSFGYLIRFCGWIRSALAEWSGTSI